MLLVTGCGSRPQEGIPLVEAVTQLKLADGLLPQASLGEVAQADATSLWMLMQQLLEVIRSPAVENQHTLPVVMCLLLLLGQLSLLDLDVVFLG